MSTKLMHLLRLAVTSLAGVTLLLVAGCETAPSYSPAAPATSPLPDVTMRAGAAEAGMAVQRAPESRPGLGTGWGEDRHSRVTEGRFDRGRRSQPWGQGRVHYNDAEGARAMAGSGRGIVWQRGGPVTVANNTLAVGLKDSRGRFLRSLSSGDDRFYIGEMGDRYVIHVQNLTPTRLEVVVSVDGLDVLDGQRASFDRRGYLIEPHGTLQIEGFRRSGSAVAAFRFSDVSGSYAAQTGSDRNVGVIGFAVFPEGGRNPFHDHDVDRRRTASPFERPYASPPPGVR